MSHHKSLDEAVVVVDDFGQRRARGASWSCTTRCSRCPATCCGHLKGHENWPIAIAMQRRWTFSSKFQVQIPVKLQVQKKKKTLAKVYKNVLVDVKSIFSKSTQIFSALVYLVPLVSSVGENLSTFSHFLPSTTNGKYIVQL